MRYDVKRNFLKLQEENGRQYNEKRMKYTLYKLNDLVAIQRTLYGVVLKLRDSPVHVPFTLPFVDDGSQLRLTGQRMVERCRIMSLTTTLYKRSAIYPLKERQDQI
ncbi:hypothetical protein AVEN_122242-1 [Araneus ventricosus]|uniref:Uncharacterized protein n=1 Tax=Araneus ventricosus TaxID=182803 RepID=A0A4Y2H7K5_ARAVE|nr:hypothetical protein AVEN_122242-1 [Araneus ventricosus]